MKTADLFPQHLIRQGLGGVQEAWHDAGISAMATALDLPNLLSHRNDPQTSLSAAVSMQIVASHHRIGCLTALTLYGPATGYELADRLGLTYIQVAKRLSELGKGPRPAIERIQTGIYHNKPLYQTRKTPSGRQACVWRVVRT